MVGRHDHGNAKRASPSPDVHFQRQRADHRHEWQRYLPTISRHGLCPRQRPAEQDLAVARPTAASIGENASAPGYYGPAMPSGMPDPTSMIALWVQRGESDSSGEITPAVVYRWRGLHARYLVSWCRRNGHAEVLTRGAGR
ncbi:hypothetical protein [Nocardia niwae]|uniref:hypothetical protein n=1 Tax=Nocardia niwae TaxID=626084 RepID=UPI0012F51688|nr:hypothetical protein [Nocardia niwae]